MGRGLSATQRGIMDYAKDQGFIAPYEACDLAYSIGDIGGDVGKRFGDYDQDIKCAAAIASRALRRLVARKLLQFERRRFRNQSNVYRVQGWHGALPFVQTKQQHNNDYGVAPLDGRDGHNPYAPNDRNETISAERRICEIALREIKKKEEKSLQTHLNLRNG